MGKITDFAVKVNSNGSLIEQVKAAVPTAEEWASSAPGWRKIGRELHGFCPRCGGDDRAWVAGGRIHCRQCGKSFDGLDLAMLDHGVKSLRELAERLGITVGDSSPARPGKKQGPAVNKDAAKVQRKIKFAWQKSTPGAESEQFLEYFKGRGITFSESFPVPPAMRFNSYKGAERIVSAISDLMEDDFHSLHSIWLDPKPGLPKKQMKGECAGRGVWFHRRLAREGKSPLVVGEGIETTLSVMMAGGMLNGCAALSASGMKSLRVPAGINQVLILTDEDKNFAGQRAAIETAKRLETEGKEVWLITPSEACFSDSPSKRDLNDILLQGGQEAVKERIEAAVRVADIDWGPPTGTTHVEAEWPDPEPVDTGLPPVEKMTDEMIPDVFRPWARDVANRMQVPVEMLVVPFVVACSSVIGAGIRIQPKKNDFDWVVVPNLWGGIIAPPSMMKTPTLRNAAMIFINYLEKEAAEEFENAAIEHEADELVRAAKIKALKADLEKAAKAERAGKETKSAEELAAELRELKGGKPPAAKRYCTTDATIEKLVELLRDNPRGILIFRDELIGLFKRWDKPDRSSDRAFMLEGWNGDGFHVDDRIGRGTIRADNVCVSLLGGIQPDKIEQYIRAAIYEGDNDGFVQRLQLLVWPDFPSSWTVVDTIPDVASKERVQSVIHGLAHLEIKPVPGKDYARLCFAPGAQKVFYEWFEWLHNEKLLPGKDPAIVTEHLAKYRSLMPSLALIFYLIDCVSRLAEPKAIDIRSAQMAAAWCQLLESHARRVYASGSVERNGVIVLARKLQEGRLSDGFKVRDVRMKKWGGLPDTDTIEMALDTLCKKSWLRKITPPGPGEGGGRPLSPTYQINPKIFSDA